MTDLDLSKSDMGSKFVINEIEALVVESETYGVIALYRTTISNEQVIGLVNTTLRSTLMDPSKYTASVGYFNKAHPEYSTLNQLLLSDSN
jgi:predicted transcriptional regulator